MQRTASDVFPITQQWYVSDRVCRAASTVSLFNSVWSSLLFLIFFSRRRGCQKRRSSTLPPNPRVNHCAFDLYAYHQHNYRWVQ